MVYTYSRGSGYYNESIGPSTKAVLLNIFSSYETERKLERKYKYYIKNKKHYNK